MMGMIVGGMLLKRSVDLRRIAFFAGAKIWIESKAVGSIETDKEIMVQIWSETDSGAKLSQGQFYLCYSPNITFNTDRISVNKEAGFDDYLLIPKNNSENGDKCVLLAVLSEKLSSDSFKSGIVKMVDLSFKTVNEGKVRIEIIAEKSALAGDNPDSDDKVILIKSAEMITFEVSNPTPTPTMTPTPTITPTPMLGCLRCSEVKSNYSGPEKSGGDYNCDGAVNGGDYVVWRNEFLDKLVGSRLQADGNCDKRVSIADYSIWREAYLGN